MILNVGLSVKKQAKRTRSSKVQAILRLVREVGVFRSRDLAGHGVPRSYLVRLQRKGFIEQIGRGLYRATDAKITAHHTLAEACKRVTHGVVCLLSALRYHNLTTQVPIEIWLAVDRTARKPQVDCPPLHIVRMSGKARTSGIEEHLIEGVPVKIYNAAKTVVDCFKFRNKIGLDIALEALREFRRSRRRNSNDVQRFAEVCRVARVMRPYLEALV